MEFSVAVRRQLNRIFREHPIELVYVFGSFVTGHATKNSDIDIAVLFSEKVSKDKRFSLRLELMGKLSRLFRRDVDAVVLNDTPSLFFQFVIIKEGRAIFYVSEAARADFESRVFGRYFDFAPFLSRYNRHYVQRNLQ